MREFRRAAEKRRKKALKRAARDQLNQCQRAPRPVSTQRATSSWAYAWLDETASLDQIPQLLPARITYVARSKKIAAFTATISGTILATVLVRWLLGY